VEQSITCPPTSQPSDKEPKPTKRTGSKEVESQEFLCSCSHDWLGQVRTACKSCRKAKLKCDDNRPCKTCSRKSKSCLDVFPIKRCKGKPSQHPQPSADLPAPSPPPFSLQDACPPEFSQLKDGLPPITLLKSLELACESKALPWQDRLLPPIRSPEAAASILPCLLQCAAS
jgi:hypothetical protein